MKKLVAAIVFVFVCSFVFALRAAAHPSWAIAVDARNRIYVSDLEKIWKIDADGAVSVFAERHTHELALDDDGNLLGEELHYEPSTRKFTAALWRISPNGEFSFTLAPTETPPKGASIWKNRAGATFYSGRTETDPRESYLLKRNPDGAVKVLFGNEKRALAERQVVPYSFGGMAFAADGALYFKNADTVWKAAPDERITLVADKQTLSPVAPSAMLFGLAVDAENNIFTADFNGGTVLKITPDKRVSAFYRSEKGWTPTGVYARGGNLFVLENKNLPPGAKPVVRVRKIAADGEISTAGTTGAAESDSPAENGSRNSSASSQNRNPLPERSGKSCFGVGLLAVCWIFVMRRN